jgi:hypothetical protein
MWSFTGFKGLLSILREERKSCTFIIKSIPFNINLSTQQTVNNPLDYNVVVGTIDDIDENGDFILFTKKDNDGNIISFWLRISEIVMLSYDGLISKEC